MAYALSAKITVGPHIFTHAKRVLINSSWQELGDTCTLCLSDLKKLMEGGIQTGMKVSVALGYGEELHKEFEGYVVQVSPSIPFEIVCEDELYHLKRLSVNQGKGKAWKDTSLKEILKEILKPVPYTLSQKIADVHLDQYRIDQGASLAEALQKIKEDFFLCAYLRNANLFVGPPYAEVGDYNKKDGTLTSYDLHGDVLENQLVFRGKEQVKLLVKVISVLPDHQKITAQAGDTGGETRTFYYPGEKDEEKLKQIAQAALERYTFEGYEGSFLTFGLPYIVHSGVVELRDARHPARQGLYRVKRVKTIWGTEGFRRKIEPGPEVKEPASDLASQKPSSYEISLENTQGFTPESDLEEPYIRERGKKGPKKQESQNIKESGVPNKERYEHEQWQLNTEKDDASLVNDVQRDVFELIGKGFALALEKINNKFTEIGKSPQTKHFKVPKSINKTDFKVTKFDCVPLWSSDEEYGVVFPVEMEMKVDVEDKNGNNIGTCKLTIDIDNPSKEEIGKSIQGPHGPHVGYEITPTGKAPEFLNVVGHVLLPKRDNPFTFPSRHKEQGQLLHQLLYLDNKKTKDYIKLIFYPKSLMFDEHTIINKDNIEKLNAKKHLNPLSLDWFNCKDEDEGPERDRKHPNPLTNKDGSEIIGYIKNTLANRYQKGISEWYVFKTFGSEAPGG